MAEYAVIIPTLNEKDNVAEIAGRIRSLFPADDWELIFVDDNSRDGTLEELYKLARQDSRIRYIRRVGRRGLASACVEGMLSSTAPCLAVLDADLQHDETKLPQMFAILKAGQANLVVASRYLKEGGTGSWNATRTRISKLATWLAGKCLRFPCTDPMSGFFALHRDLIDKSAEDIQSRGFKILFDLLTQRDLQIKLHEIPYTFKERTAGETKLGFSVMVDFLWLLLSRYIGRFVYAEFVMFCIVGLTGVGVHLSSLFILHDLLEKSFLISQSAATLVAMSSNYALNNLITFRQNRLTGKKYLLGYAQFIAACTLGALGNIAVADFLNRQGIHWSLAASAGVAFGAIINFFFAKFFVWKKERSF